MVRLHMNLTKKNGQLMIIHYDILKQAFEASDPDYTIAVLKIPFHDSDLTFVTVRESVTQINKMLDDIERKNQKAVNKNGEHE